MLRDILNETSRGKVKSDKNYIESRNLVCKSLLCVLSVRRYKQCVLIQLPLSLIIFFTDDSI